MLARSYTALAGSRRTIMGEAGWGITFVLGIGTMVTVVLVTLAIQIFRIARLRMQLDAHVLPSQGQHPDYKVGS
jgi:hypothetical protein